MKTYWVSGNTVPRTLNLDGKSSEMLHILGTSPHNTLKRRVKVDNLTTLTTNSNLTFIYPCIANLLQAVLPVFSLCLTRPKFSFQAILINVSRPLSISVDLY